MMFLIIGSRGSRLCTISQVILSDQVGQTFLSVGSGMTVIETVKAV